jgi:hypothetical protein
MTEETKMPDFPERIKKMKGGVYVMRGNVFGRKYTPPTNFIVIDFRWGIKEIMNMDTLERHPSVEFLVKNDNMKRAIWTRGFSVDEITHNN